MTNSVIRKTSMTVNNQVIKSRLKKGDMVMVISGNWRGTTDYISRLDPKKRLVYLKKVNRQVYDRSTAEIKEKSQFKTIMLPLRMCKVAYWLAQKKKTTRISLLKLNDKKERRSVKYDKKLV